MKRLILMRHAKTEPWFQGTDDESRALVPRGHADAGLIADALLSSSWSPDFVVLSPARRTRETWSAMQDYFPKAEKKIIEDLYLIGTRGLADIVRSNDHAGTLMVVGHNPGMHDFACQIVAEAGTTSQPAALSLSQKMPTGAVALFEAANERAFNAEAFRLIDFIRPKTLRSDA
ncbi:MAG: histidine phosphatase family protein [Pseudomonadota bacterium]